MQLRCESFGMSFSSVLSFVLLHHLLPMLFILRFALFFKVGTVFCYAILCYAMLYDAMLYYTMLCNAMLYYAVLCGAMPCYAMLCYAMLYDAMLCYTMLCQAMQCNRKSFRNRFQNDPKSVQNPSKICPKSFQDRLRHRPRCQHRFWTVLRAFSERFGTAFGSLLAASRGSQWDQVGPKIDFWRSWMAFKNTHDAGYFAEPIFGPCWNDFGVRN